MSALLGVLDIWRLLRGALAVAATLALALVLAVAFAVAAVSAVASTLAPRGGSGGPGTSLGEIPPAVGDTERSVRQLWWCHLH